VVGGFMLFGQHGITLMGKNVVLVVASTTYQAYYLWPVISGTEQKKMTTHMLCNYIEFTTNESFSILWSLICKPRSLTSENKKREKSRPSGKRIKKVHFVTSSTTKLSVKSK
jgi:hypothetical protein